MMEQHHEVTEPAVEDIVLKNDTTIPPVTELAVYRRTENNTLKKVRLIKLRRIMEITRVVLHLEVGRGTEGEGSGSGQGEGAGSDSGAGNGSGSGNGTGDGNGRR